MAQDITRPIARPWDNSQLIAFIRAAGNDLIAHAESYAGDIFDDGSAPTQRLTITTSFEFDGETVPTIEIRRECLSRCLVDAMRAKDCKPI